MAKLHYRDSPSEKERKRFAKYLAEDEELTLATGYGRVYLTQLFIIYILLPGAIFILAGLALSFFLKFNLGYGLLIGLIGAILFAWIKTLHTYNAHRYLLTTRRLIVKQGFFTVKINSALYDKITHIEVDQSLYDRLVMHHGKVIIHTAGMNKNEITLNYVETPIEFKNLLERLINREREEFGRRGEVLTTLEGEIIE